jgi:hypothetical protein
MSQSDSIGVGDPLSPTAVGRIVRVAGAASGIAAVVAEVVAGFVMPWGTGPKSGTSAQVFLESVRDHQAALRGYSLMAGLLSLFLLWYAVSLGTYYPGGLPQDVKIQTTGSEDKWVLTPSFSVLRIEERVTSTRCSAPPDIRMA